MALLTYNGTNFDTMLGSAAILGTTVNVTTGGISSLGVTAPNTTNKITGCWISVSSLPSVSNSGNLTVEIMESGVSKALATINYADIKLGFNYVRFATPYQFTTVAAGAYIARVKNTVGTGSLGQLRLATTNLWFEFTYDLTVATPAAATDNVWVGGFNDAGLTPKVCTISGTSNAWGTGAATGIGSTTQTMGAAVTCGSGGTLKYDQSASTTLSILGSIFATVGGVFDMRPPSTKSIISTLIIDGVANGDQGIFTGTTANGGQILTTGATYNASTTFASGLGTAASPLIVATGWDADVGDEIVIGGATDYLKNEVRYIKTRNSSTSFVLCSTPGGAEVALTQTHAVGSHIANLQRNSIIKALNTARGWYANNATNTALSDFKYTRMEYSDCSSGRSLSFQTNTQASIDGVVLYNNPISGRHCIIIPSDIIAQTFTDITLYNTRGGNYSGQSGIGLSSSVNKTFTNVLQFNAPSSVDTCAMFSINLSSVANTFNNCHSYGANAANNASGYCIGIYSSSANTFNNCSVNSCRANAVYFANGAGNIFNNCKFGNMGVNGNDIGALSATLNQALFNACTFGSSTLISNYLPELETSEIAFQDMDASTSKHRWYTNHGSLWSAGTGLADTTVRTAGSLSLAMKPEDATVGLTYSFKIPASPASSVGVLGYVYRNAALGSAVAKVELFLPGNTTVTPDATYTFPTTTLAWLPFDIAAYYSGSVARYATVKVTVISNTAGAILFLDDLYDATTNNKVAGFDLWDNGKPSPVMVVTDFSSAVPVISAAVAAILDAQLDAILSNTDATQAKVDLL